MADQADVETALAAIVANALYPNGTTAASAIGNTCRIYRGFPTAPSLDADLAAGVLNVSVAADDAALKNVTRYPRRWVSVAPVTQVLTVNVTGPSACFSGSCAVGQLAGVMVNEALFPYAVQLNDSPETVASNLAAMCAWRDGWSIMPAPRSRCRRQNGSLRVWYVGPAHCKRSSVKFRSLKSHCGALTLPRAMPWPR